MRHTIVLSLSLVISAAPLTLAQTSGSSTSSSSVTGGSTSAGSTSAGSTTAAPSGSSSTGSSTSAGSASGSSVSGGSASGGSVSGSSASGSSTSSATSTRTIAAIVTGDPQFSTLLRALKAAGLDKTLAGTGPFTVFAPTNAAFNKIPANTLNSLLNNKAALTKLLQSHVVKGKLDAKGVVAAKSIAALSGEKLTVTAAGSSVKVNNATVIKADQAASNGVIHVVDTVIMPGMAMSGGSTSGSSTTGSSTSGSTSGGSTSGGSTSGGSTSGSSTGN